MSSDRAEPAPQFLVHRDGDHVGVAVVDLRPGRARGVVLRSDRPLEAAVRASIPYGHKFALVARSAGEPVIEYGVPIGIAVSNVAEGDHVHVHNMRSARWPQSQGS